MPYSDSFPPQDTVTWRKQLESSDEAAGYPNLTFTPRQYVLSDEQVKQVHRATLEVLETTGIKVTHPDALEIFHGSGAKVDQERVRLPGWMVENALSKAPSEIMLANRRGDNTVLLKDDLSWFGPTLDCFDFLDPLTDLRRPFTSEDCRKTALLADALPNFTWNMTIGVCSDVPAGLADRVIARQALTYSEKPLVFCCAGLQDLKDIYEMGALIAGSEERLLAAPHLVSFHSPISPLMHDYQFVDKLIFTARKGLPQVCYSGPQAGSTAPVTTAGTLIQGSAESLSGIVLGQLVRPGSPFIYGAFTTIMDMVTTVFSYGAPEMNLMAAAMSQMAHFYKLPFYGMSGCSDAKLAHDPQAAVEATFSCLSAALSGANMVHDNGWLDHSTVVSPAYMVLVNEVLDMVNHYMKGIPLNPENMALEVMDSVGPAGHYLLEEHTMKHFREIWYSRLFDRTGKADWLAQGAKGFQERLREKTQKMLEYEPEPLPTTIVQELDNMALKWE